MKNLEIINVSNGTDEYIGNFVYKEKKIIHRYMTGRTLHLFSGKSNIGDVRVDFKFGTEKKDVFEYLENCKDSFDTIILDPPYNTNFADQYQKIGNTPKQFIIFANTQDTTKLWNEIIRLNPKIIILKSWNYYIPKGYQLKKGYLCYAGGYRKPTILLIIERENTLYYYDSEDKK